MAKKRKCSNRVVVKVSFSMTPKDGRELRRLPATLDSLAPLFEHLNLPGFAEKHGLVYMRDGHANMGVDLRNLDGCACEKCIARDIAEREKETEK